MMKLTRLFFSALLAFSAVPFLALAAPVVSNVSYIQQPDGAGSTEIVVSYDLVTPNGPAETVLLYSVNAAPFAEALAVSGDVGPGQTAGSLTITWAVADDLPGVDSSNLVLRVVAEDGVPIPLIITSEAPTDVHQIETQKLTFTFAEGVTGFDATDVTLSGGTKGMFEEVSAEIYTLDVTGTGGTVTASVAAGAAQSASGTGNGNAADSFSNFYQDTWTLDLDGGTTFMELIRIPAGTFTMGSPAGPDPPAELSRSADETEHQVTISQDFYLGKTEVTQAQWLAIRGSWPGTAPSAAFGMGDDYPAYSISHDDIQTFMADLDTAITEPGAFGLPTESQWEYACRAGTTTRFSFGDGLHPTAPSGEACETTTERTDNMWYCGNNTTDGTKSVGQKFANAWGLYDMHGNTWEWCADWYGSYPAGPVTDPTGPASGSSRVVRGGSWSYHARDCRSAQRSTGSPDLRFIGFGFRVLGVRPMPMVITSTLAEGSVSETQNQTLTFTFDSAVSDFTIDDIQLTGATPGTFTEVSPTEYTLDVSGTGGRVTASVSPTSPATAPATFSNFYQDTWTLDLPGSVPMELIRIPAGTYTMGSPAGPDPPAEFSRNADEVQHDVTLSQDFYLGKTEVTQEQWLAIYGVFPDGGQSHGTGAGSETRAVHRVSHDDIVNASTGYMKLLNDHITATMQGPAVVMLPTESQWEYACRAGTLTRFNFGDGFGSDETCSAETERTNNMWYCGNDSPNGTKLVGQKPANAWGLHDMHGNVREWCSDWYGIYPGTVTDPTGPVSGLIRVFRGGGWVSNARGCRSAQRSALTPSGRTDVVGFRVLAVR